MSCVSQPLIRTDVRAFLDALESQPRPVFTDELMATIRQMSPEMMASSDLPVGELGQIRDVVMPGPAGDIALRLFDPRKERGPGPVVVFYHGGGFVVGNIDTHAGLAAAIARGLDLPVISVEYRLAPEHKWPAAPDDAEAAARWIAENGAAFGREFTHLIPCGDSAGGNLALVATLALRDRPTALPVPFQFIIYPKADSTCVRASARAFADGYGMESVNLGYYDQAYAPDPANWRHSPILADLAGLPPMLLVTASLDPLRDEGRAFAAKAIEAGVQVAYREVEGTIHGFMTYRKAIPSAAANTEALLVLAKAMIAEALGA
jgi:acetyl esterase